MAKRMNKLTNIETAIAEVFNRCDGDHTRDCCWHAVMAVDENFVESGYEGDAEYVENALALIDDNCQCAS